MCIYLHLPFCAASCPYCDYPHAAGHPPDAREAFVDALCEEIRLRTRFHGAPVETLYLGGGTPSQLSAAHLERLLAAIHSCFDLSTLGEITLEANPDDLSPPYLDALHALGVNRLSLGVQSFFEEDLRFLSRQHTAEETARAVPLVRANGFENVSVDLLFGLPGQTEARWQATLEKTIQQAPPHVTLYRLTADPKTPLGRRVVSSAVAMPSEDAVAAQYEQALDVLAAAGYALYEQTHLARPGFEAQHTSRYWRHAPVLGLGPSAHSFFWNGDGAPAPATRRANAAALYGYTGALLEGTLPPARSETLSQKMLAEEYVALRLRTAAGLDLRRLDERYGCDLRTEKPAVLARLRNESYLENHGDGLCLTRAGRLRFDAVVAALI